MQRPLIAALLLGVLNAVVAVVLLVLVDAATPDDFGWFAYAPLHDGVVLRDPRFPWHYVVVPLVLVAINALVVPLYLRRALRRDGAARPSPR